MDMETFRPNPSRRSRSKSPIPSKNGTETRVRLEDTQRQVDEITDIMKNNVELMANREIKLDELDKRAESLSERAKLFEDNTTKIKKKFWMKNKKACGIIIVLVCVLSLIAGITIYLVVT